jgi:hypothetical protein
MDYAVDALDLVDDADRDGEVLAWERIGLVIIAIVRQSAGVHIVCFDGAHPVRGRYCKRTPTLSRAMFFETGADFSKKRQS